jgi:hypothetical protein
MWSARTPRICPQYDMPLSIHLRELIDLRIVRFTAHAGWRSGSQGSIER